MMNKAGDEHNRDRDALAAGRRFGSIATSVPRLDGAGLVRRSCRPGFLPVLAALAAATTTVTPVTGQDTPLLLDVDGGMVIPVGAFADGSGPGEGTEAGPALELGFTLPRSDRFAIQLGFHQHRFGCEPAGCAADGEYVATGFDLGLRFSLLTGHRVFPWISAGGVTTRVETDALPAPDAGVSKLGWGVKAGAGLYIGLGWVAVHPKVSFGTVESELPGGGTMGLRWVAATLGVSFPF
jgi:hypothetical protein